jgi:hypothetical protein
MVYLDKHPYQPGIVCMAVQSIRQAITRIGFRALTSGGVLQHQHE